jgi:membrane protease subunit (stomatin/prohibitin family)
MGYYINPKDMTKEEFLVKNGTPISKKDFLYANFEDNGQMIVVLVDNGPFTAAAIMESNKELRDWQFQTATDYRPTKYFICPVKCLKPYL